MRWLGVAIVGLLSSGCWGGWGENPCGEDVVIEGSRWTNPNTGDQLVFENGQAVFRPASGVEAQMDIVDPPADFLPIDCRFGEGRPAAHALRRFQLTTSSSEDVLVIHAQDGLQFAETTSVAAVIDLEVQRNTQRISTVFIASIDSSGTTMSIPLTFNRPSSGRSNLSVSMQLDLDLIGEDGSGQSQSTDLWLTTTCFDGQCVALTSYPAVECL